MLLGTIILGTILIRLTACSDVFSIHKLTIKLLDADANVMILKEYREVNIDCVAHHFKEYNVEQSNLFCDSMYAIKIVIFFTLIIQSSG